MHDSNNYTNYRLRINISPSQNLALTCFENDINDMVRNIEFRNVRNDFQDKLKEDIHEIRFSQNLYREDGFAAINKANGPKLDRIAKDIIALFKEDLSCNYKEFHKVKSVDESALTDVHYVSSQ